MATLTIGTASGGYYNYRGTNATPYAMGSSVAIASSGGDIAIGTNDGIVVSTLTAQAAGNGSTSVFYGNVWNGSGVSVTSAPGVTAAVDTAAPFAAQSFNLSDFYLAPQTVYVGFSRAAADDCNWDVVNGNNTTRVGNTAGSAPSGLTGTGTGTIYRRLVGTLTYTVYSAGNISQSVSQPSDRTATVTYAGTSGTYGKNVVINWGDGTTNTSYTVAAGGTPAAQSHTYATAGTRTITTTISYATTAVAIPDIPLSTSFTTYTVPSAPQTFTATTASGTSVNLSWAAPSYLGSGTITYQLYRGATLLQNSSATSFSDTGLSLNTTYSYSVYATNTWGQSTGASASATTFNVPNAPQSLSVTPGTASTAVTQAVATWSAPSSNGGSAIIRYEYSTDGTNWTNNSTSLSATVTSLSKYASYTFYVRAVNAVGNSTSTTASFTTFGGRYAVYSGSVWIDKYAQKYDGSSWSNAPVRKYNGTTWDYTDR